jgi:hypothetical protein
MMYWIQRGTRLFSGSIFFIVLISIVLSSGSLSISYFAKGIIYASVSAMLCWFVGFVIIDIIVKGIVTHIEEPSADSIIDGGFLQRVKMMQEQVVPGGKEMPFVDQVQRSSNSDENT